jgi:superfamily I DNA/RNA helicase
LYQEAIFDFFLSGNGGARINAVAGSGKTTTLVQSSSRIQGTALFCAFNKHIEQELSGSLGNVACKTIHSIGMGALYRHIGKLHVDEDKYRDICLPMASDFARNMRRKSGLDEDALKTRGKISRTILSLSRMAMMTLTDPSDHEALLKMSKMYSIRVPKCQREDFFKVVPKVIEKGEKLTKDGRISFSDMIYYPAIKNLSCKEHLWVMVDEAQDLSAAQLAIVMNSLKGRGRLIAVGDPGQSLYGFTGADPWSFDSIKEYAPTDLPLSICYRCASSIVDLASHIVPQIEAREGAPEGTVKEIDTCEFNNMVSNGDMVLCRVNAPLVDVTINLIAEGKKAHMRGRDLMTTFLDIVNMVIEQPGYSWNRFGNILHVLEEEMRIKLIMDGEEGAASHLSDMYSAVGKCAEKLNCHNATQLTKKIKDLFRESPDSILCTSVHRAKGLEADTVFMIKPHRIRLQWKDQQDWQKYQEQCCEYVAITRARENLYMVRGDGDPGYKVGNPVDLPDRK